MSEASKNLSMWLVKLYEHPLKALEDCRESYARSAGAHTEKLYESIGFMTAFVHHLNSDERSLSEFRDHRFWASNARATSSKHLSIMAVRFLLGAGEAKGALYEQARSYAKLVEFFLSEKTEPSAIPEVLRRKTIYGLLDQLAKGGVKKAGVVSARSNSDESDSSVSSDESDTGEADDASESDSDPEDDGEQDSSDNADDSTEPPLAAERRCGVSVLGAFTYRAKEISEQGKMPLLAAVKPEDWAKLVRYLKEGRVEVVCSGNVGEDEWVEVICEKVRRSRT